ncbi:hypothetical protein ADUPG1_007147, partial [Aduncisulcus paluster]
MTKTVFSSSCLQYTSCNIHPTVLITIQDHFRRIRGSTKKRAVGILLGRFFGGVLDVTNCFSIPFDESRSSSDVWYVDVDYTREMYAMFKKVNVKERFVGWYSTSPDILPQDVAIHKLIKETFEFDHKAVRDPILACVNCFSQGDRGYDKTICTPHALISEAKADGTIVSEAFSHVTHLMKPSEVEEIGVEHLLRDVGAAREPGIEEALEQKLDALKQLQKSLRSIKEYLVLHATEEEDEEETGKEIETKSTKDEEVESKKEEEEEDVVSSSDISQTPSLKKPIFSTADANIIAIAQDAISTAPDNSKANLELTQALEARAKTLSF